LEWAQGSTANNARQPLHSNFAVWFERIQDIAKTVYVSQQIGLGNAVICRYAKKGGDLGFPLHITFQFVSVDTLLKFRKANVNIF